VRIAGAPDSTAARNSVRMRLSPTVHNAPSRERRKPVSPVSAARSGRTIGSGRKWLSSRRSRGKLQITVLEARALDRSTGG
jgi:hypothetical protein